MAVRSFLEAKGADGMRLTGEITVESRDQESWLVYREERRHRQPQESGTGESASIRTVDSGIPA